MEEISKFYSNPAEAFELLVEKRSKQTMNLEYLQKLHRAEKSLFDLRVKNRIPQTINLLRIALDNSPPTPKEGRRAATFAPTRPAYQGPK